LDAGYSIGISEQVLRHLRTNGKELIPFVVSLSNALLSEVEGHEWNQLAQSFL
jgi:hypothetical protein